MIITYHTGGFVKITSGDTVVAFNPISKNSKLKETKFGADVAFISVNHPDCNGTESVSRSNKELFIVDGPGEYEVSGIFAKGVGTKSEYSGESRINTMYSVHIEDIHMLYLGALNEEKLSGKQLEDIEDIDILFVPVGGNGILHAGAAQKLANSLEAKIIIPIFWEEDSLKTFLQEAGVSDNRVERLAIKKKDITEQSGEVVVIAA